MRSSLVMTIFGAALLSASCGDTKPAVTNAASAAPAPVAKPVVAEPVVEAGLVATGPIIVEHQVEMTAQRDGILEKIYFDAPARVKAGTLLAQLDGRQIAAN